LTQSPLGCLVENNYNNYISCTRIAFGVDTGVCVRRARSTTTWCRPTSSPKWASQQPSVSSGLSHRPLRPRRPTSPRGTCSTRHTLSPPMCTRCCRQRASRLRIIHRSASTPPSTHLLASTLRTSSPLTRLGLTSTSLDSLKPDQRFTG